MKKSLILILIMFIFVSCWKSSDSTSWILDWTNTNTTTNSWIIENSIQDWQTSTWKINETFSMEEVKIHNIQLDCYTVIDWKIYNISPFFWKHPWWDEKLLWLCWVDWSSLFNTVHWTNEKAQMTREEYYIWDLAK